MRKGLVLIIFLLLIGMIPQATIRVIDTIDVVRSSSGFTETSLPSTPIVPNQWLEYWSNSSGGEPGNLRYKITSGTNSTWWEVEVWNQTTTSLNQTSYVKKVPGEGGHEHCYAVESYAVYTSVGTSHPNQWDKWFDLDGVSIGSDIGPIETKEGESMTLSVNISDSITTAAGTFDCWLANTSQFEMGFWFYTNYWIDKETNITVRSTTEIPAFSQLLVDELVAASWLAPPVISSVFQEASKTSAEISWNTDKESNSTVCYGVSPSNLNLTEDDSARVLSHMLSLSNLEPVTTYYFNVASTDYWGNSVRDNNSGAYYSFTTLSAATPEISFILAEPLSNTSIQVTFDTDIETNATIWYGTTDLLNEYVSDPVFSVHHEINIVGLEEYTLYFFKICTSDDIGNRANSSVRSSRTLDQTAPYVVSFSHIVNRGELNVSVESNELFRCELYLGSDSGSVQLSLNETSFKTEHVLVIANLESYSMVYFRIKLIDLSGNHLEYQDGTELFSDSIPDYLNPEITHPDDIYTTESHQDLLNISWTVSDQTPDSYEIFVNGESTGLKSWNTTVISTTLAELGLGAGTHSIKLVLRDEFGNTVSDTVIVTITAESTELITGNQILVLGVGFIVVVVLASILRRR